MGGCQWCCCLQCHQPLKLALPLQSAGSAWKHAVFFIFLFSNGAEFSFCFPKAGSKACAMFVSAPHPQQWLLKFGRGYMSEGYTHFCTFHDCKRARLFSRQLRETRQVPQASLSLPPPTHRAALALQSRLGMGETSAL